MSLKSVVLLIAAAGFFVGAALAAWRTAQFVSASDVAAGRVVALNAGGSHPQIRFTTHDGTTIDYPQGGLIGGYRVGDAVPVRYRSADPKESASVDTFGALWAVPAGARVLRCLPRCRSLPEPRDERRRRDALRMRLRPSAWTYNTAATAGAGIAFVAAAGGHLFLKHPSGKDESFWYGGIGGAQAGAGIAGLVGYLR